MITGPSIIANNVVIGQILKLLIQQLESIRQLTRQLSLIQ